jgi:hypothetical protein
VQRRRFIDGRGLAWVGDHEGPLPQRSQDQVQWLRNRPMASAGQDNLTRRLHCNAARGSSGGLEIDQGLAQLGIHILVCLGHLLFKCPRTGLNVQHWLEEVPDDPSDAYKPVVCQACTKLHFINISNGKLLGETER